MKNTSSDFSKLTDIKLELVNIVTLWPIIMRIVVKLFIFKYCDFLTQYYNFFVVEKTDWTQTRKIATFWQNDLLL